MIYIHKGDSTIFANITKFLTFNILTENDITNWQAVFSLGSITKTIPLLNDNFEVILTATETQTLMYGNIYGSIRLIDSDGNIKTVINTIPFCVTNKVIENQPETIDLVIPDNPEINITLQVGTKYVTYDELNAALATKQPVGNYATAQQLEAGLATKQPIGDYATVTYVMQAIASIPQFKLSIVNELPEIGEKMTLYLVPKDGTDNDVYNEYIWLDDLSKFEFLGTTAVDLTDYLTAEKLGIAKVSQPMTQAEYEVLTPDANTLYLIKED